MFGKDCSTHQGGLQHLLYEPQDNLAHRFPVSVEGIVRRDAQVVLLHNERNEWELPGGKLEPDESPEQCAVHEIHPPSFPRTGRPKAFDPGGAHGPQPKCYVQTALRLAARRCGRQRLRAGEPPSLRASERVIAALHCRPHDCIFIDDLSWNVERARTVGMRATQFTSTAALREFLIQEGIAFPTVGAS